MLINIIKKSIEILRIGGTNFLRDELKAGLFSVKHQYSYEEKHVSFIEVESINMFPLI